MSFFQGATNVKISGQPSFNVVYGNQNQFDYSRHTTNIDSFNTRNTTTVGSNNDSSQRYNNVRPGFQPPIDRNAGREIRGPSPNNGQYGYPSHPPSGNQQSYPSQAYPPMHQTPYGSQAPYNSPYSQYQPPAHQPPYGSPALLPPGGRVNNVNSFNVHNEHIQDSYNDNSYKYDEGYHSPPRGRAKAKKSGTAHESDDDSDGYEDDPAEMPASFPRKKGKRAQAAHQAQTLQSNSRFPASQSASTLGLRAQAINPQVQSMTPAMQASFQDLMNKVREETAWSGDEDDSDDDGDKMAPKSASNVPLDARMANLDLNDPSRPTFSRVKSDPQNPLSTNSQSITPPVVSAYAESTLDVPNHIQQKFVQPEQATMTPPNSYIPNAWPNNLGSAPVNAANGPSSLVDHSTQVTNLRSGNTDNAYTAGSHNDSSIGVNVTPPVAKKSRRRWF